MTDIDSISAIMCDINSISKDIAVETQSHNQKLERLEIDITTADENTELAVGEIIKTAASKKKEGRCMKCIYGMIIISILTIVMAFINDPKLKEEVMADLPDLNWSNCNYISIMMNINNPIYSIIF